MRLGFFAPVIVALATGCSYHIQSLVEPAPAPSAKHRAHGRATCESKRLEIGQGLFAELEGWERTHPGSHAGQVNALSTIREGRPAPLVAAARESRLFASVGEAGDADARLVLTRRLIASPEIGGLDAVRTILTIVFPIPTCVWAFFYLEQDPPFTIELTLDCFGRDGRSLARVSTTAKVRYEAQALAATKVDPHLDGLRDALEVAEPPALAHLFELLAKDLPSRPLVAEAPPPREPVAPPPPQPTTPPKLSPAPPAAREGRAFVLVVAIDAYDDAKIPRLRFAEADGREVYSFFATDRKSPTDADRVKLVAGKSATRRGVLEAIRDQLARKAIEPDDAAILYFAGHGFADADDTYLACSDTALDSLPETAISTTALNEAWGKIRCGRKVLLCDACRSGGAGRVRGIGGVALAPAAATTSLTIAATGPNELSTEDEQLGHGVYTTALLKGLRGEADQDGDGRVTGAELARYLRSEVPRLAALVGGKQSPTVAGDGGATYYLTRRGDR